eukprot:TRINITY_DN1965_c0_g1_i1.p1 TRINITY_DN1965_c0_g1~~TRINITY_DN1965_c0_g1_i1.p1  ORF type:complete len:104 (-),score=20.76 TRINITY_DN1965_c0_g1_i1:13-324(-)
MQCLRSRIQSQITSRTTLRDFLFVSRRTSFVAPSIVQSQHERNSPNPAENKPEPHYGTEGPPLKEGEQRPPQTSAEAPRIYYKEHEKKSKRREEEGPSLQASN